MANYSLNLKSTDTPSGLVQLQLDTGTEAMRLCVVLRCQLPEGFMVSGSANIPGCNPPIYLPPTLIHYTEGADEFTMHLCCDAPADYSSLIVAHWHANGKTTRPGMKLSIELVQIIGPEHALYHDAGVLTVFPGAEEGQLYRGLRIGYREQVFMPSVDGKL